MHVDLAVQRVREQARRLGTGTAHERHASLVARRLDAQDVHAGEFRPAGAAYRAWVLPPPGMLRRSCETLPSFSTITRLAEAIVSGRCATITRVRSSWR